MNKLTKSDLLSLEEYSLNRDRLREEVLVLKKDRKIQIGINVTLLFENLKTIKYQIQEMLRIEKIFEPNGIQEELDAYNPLIPDGSNLKATMFIEFQKESVRKEKLKSLVGESFPNFISFPPFKICVIIVGITALLLCLGP